MAQVRVPPFSAAIIEAVAGVIGDTTNGLTGSQISLRLREVPIPDVDPDNTKRKRLYNAMTVHQDGHKNGEAVVGLIHAVMKPARFVGDPAQFSHMQGRLNEVLVLEGLRVNDKGRVVRLKAGAATTLDEAASRAGQMRTELHRRRTHQDVVRYCTDELLAKNNFHACLEATKSVPDRLRTMTRLGGDGAKIVQDTLLPSDRPLVSINSGRTETDRSEQAGFANVALGLVGLYRNPTAHEPKIRRTVSDEELL
ncbi:MAG: TIGR02391 family protein [Gammaproteobacteria bacterium]|nr:TIGR02391 family protein [Gammaproteobacteria bacterium]